MVCFGEATNCGEHLVLKTLPRCKPRSDDVTNVDFGFRTGYRMFDTMSDCCHEPVVLESFPNESVSSFASFKEAGGNLYRSTGDCRVDRGVADCVLFGSNLPSD